MDMIELTGTENRLLAGGHMIGPSISWLKGEADGWIMEGTREHACTEPVTDIWIVLRDIALVRYTWHLSDAPQTQHTIGLAIWITVQLPNSCQLKFMLSYLILHYQLYCTVGTIYVALWQFHCLGNHPKPHQVLVMPLQYSVMCAELTGRFV